VVLEPLELDLLPFGFRDLAGPHAGASEASRLVVARRDVADELVLRLLAHEVGERLSHREDDLAKRIFGEQPPLLDSQIGGTHAGAALRPHVDHLADADRVNELRKGPGAQTLALSVSLAQDHVADRVREHRVLIDPRRDALDLRGLDFQTRGDDVAVSSQRKSDRHVRGEPRCLRSGDRRLSVSRLRLPPEEGEQQCRDRERADRGFHGPSSSLLSWTFKRLGPNHRSNSS
jgi:hypothetical protein